MLVLGRCTTPQQPAMAFLKPVGRPLRQIRDHLEMQNGADPGSAIQQPAVSVPVFMAGQILNISCTGYALLLGQGGAPMDSSQ